MSGPRAGRFWTCPVHAIIDRHEPSGRRENPGRRDNPGRRENPEPSERRERRPPA
jgi:hypothetical protein